MKGLIIPAAEMFAMEALSARYHIFDVDHTITARSTGVRMGQVGVDHKYVSRLTIMQFPLIYMRYRAGKYNLNNLPGKLKQFEGMSCQTITEWGQATFDEYIKDEIFPPVLQLIQHLKHLGKSIILCTSSLDFVIKPLAEFLGVDAVVATELKFNDDGICTGEIKGLPAFGEGKVMKMNAWVAEKGLDLADMAFYSDSINDLPLLNKVKYPVPTNPDKLLRKCIKTNNWKYLEFRK